MTADETGPLATETKLQCPLPSATTATAIAAGTVPDQIVAMSMEAKLHGPPSSPPPPSSVPAAVAVETEATLMEVKPSSPAMEVKPSSPPPPSAAPAAASTDTTAAADGDVEKERLVGEIENLKLETKKLPDRSINEESDGDRSQYPPGPGESSQPGDGAGAILEKSVTEKPVEGNIRVLEADSVLAAENNAPVEEGNHGADLERKLEGGEVDGGVSMVINDVRDPGEMGVEATGFQEKKGKQIGYWGSSDKCTWWRKKNEEGVFEDKSRGNWPENQNRLNGKMGRVSDEEANVWNSEERFNVHGDYGHNESKYYEVFEIPLPLRPGKPNCAYYLKTGKCGYGTNCMFNHPPDRMDHQVAGEQIKDHSEGVGQIICKFYLLPGGCKHGDACRYRHATGNVELNFLGLPLRPGQRECQFYMRTGTCKYSTSCYFHHPEPTAAAEENSFFGYENDELPQILLPGASQFSETFQTFQLQSKEPTSFSKGSGSLFPAMLFPPQKQNSWEDDQVPLDPLATSKGNMQQPSTFNHATYIDDQQTPMKEYPEIPESDAPNHQTSNTEYPERIGNHDCAFFMKNGYCIFRSACVFHHPKSRPRREPPFTFNPIGLPIRNDQPICSFYSRLGICKYGPACKFSHPVDFQSRSSVPEENTATKEEW